MTILKGRPDVPDNTPLTAQLTYLKPYRQGQRLGIGTHSLTFDWVENRWEQGSAPFDLVAARWGQGRRCAGPCGAGGSLRMRG